MLAEDDLEAFPSGDELRRLYDLVVFPGHTEYVTEHAYDVVQRFRDLGGRLIFLSANNFFWKVEKNGQWMRRVKLWRDLGRPESALLGVQYRANDNGTKQGVYQILDTAAAPWLFAGTGLQNGSTLGEMVGGYGIEIDSTTPFSPPGTKVLARIPDLFGPGLSGEMTYYETEQGARVFSAGVAGLRRFDHVPAGVAHARQPLAAHDERLAVVPHVYDSRPMRRLVLLVLALAVVPPAAAADLTVAPRDFSPTAKRLRIQASLPQAEHVGVQLARADGRVLGWIVPPERRRFLDFRWNGRLGAGASGTAATGSGSSTASASSPRRRSAIDQTAPAPDEHPRAQPRPAAVPGRQQALHDDLPERRQAARVRQDRLHARRARAGALRGDADAQLAGDDLRALGEPEAGAAHVHLVPALVDRGAHVPDPPEHARQAPATAAPTAPTMRARAASSRSAVVRVLGVDAGFTAESYVASSAARLAIETDATSLTLQTFRAGRRGHAHAQRHADERRPRRPAGDDRVEGAPPPGDAEPRARPLADRRLLRQADRERRPDRLRALRDPPDDASASGAASRS